MKKNIFLLSVLIPALLLLTFSSCITEEQRVIFQEFIPDVEEYYNTKYNSDATVEYYNFCAYNGNVPVLDKRLFEMSDGELVIWNEEKQQFYDTKQGEEISKALYEEICCPIMEEFVEKDAVLDIKFADIGFNSFFYNNLKYSSFNTYYCGDIDKVLENEEITLKTDYIFLTCDPEKDYRSLVDERYEELKNYFTAIDTCIYMYDTNCFLPDTYDKYDRPSIYDEDILSIYKLSFNEDSGKQCSNWYQTRYIEVLPGVSISYNGANYLLEDGDITFEESITKEEFQDILDSVYNDEIENAEENPDKKIYRYIIDPSTPIYKPSLSSEELSDVLVNENGSLYFDWVIDQEKMGEYALYYCEYIPKNDEYDAHLWIRMIKDGIDSIYPIYFYDSKYEYFYFIGSVEYEEYCASDNESLTSYDTDSQ